MFNRIAAICGLGLLFILFVCGDKIYAQATAPSVPVVTKLVKLKTADTEVADTILYLEKMKETSPQDIPYLRFFTTYAIRDATQRQQAALELSFLCHSMIGVVNKTFVGGGYYPIAHMEKAKPTDEENTKFIADHQVPGSDTLWWIDLRDYNWTEQAWENMMKEDGYMVEPVITHDKNSLLRLYSGNALIRADWFIPHASTLTNQADVDSKTKIYKEFLYGSIGNKQPQNVLEFEKVWSIDTVKAQEIGNVAAVLVTKSDAVARHNRMLFFYRTELGWYSRTYDVKNIRGKRDYAENLLEFRGNPPPVFDGGEIFATNFLRLQVYDLYDGKEKIVDFADPTVVRHMSDVLGDARVRTAFSCLDCHAAGPIPSENSLLEFIKTRAIGYVYNKEDALRVKRVFLDKQFEEAVEESQILFAKSLLKVNGLTPAVNGKYYLNQVTNYDKPLTVEQAAHECGMTPETFVQAVKEKNQSSDKYKVPFRLAKLIADGEPIAREAWESPGADGQPGVFQQTMIILHGLTSITYTNEINPVIEALQSATVIAIADGDVKSGSTTIAKYKKGDKFIASGKNPAGWIGVEINGQSAGYIKQENAKIVK